MNTAEERLDLASGKDLQSGKVILYTRLKYVLLPRAATVLKALFLKVWNFNKKSTKDTRPDNEIFFAAAGDELIKRFNKRKKKLVTLESLPLWTLRITSIILQEFNFEVGNLSIDDKVKLKSLDEAKVEIESCETSRMNCEDFERLWKSITDVIIHFGDDHNELGHLKTNGSNHLLQIASKIYGQIMYKNRVIETKKYYNGSGYNLMLKKCILYSSIPHLTASETRRIDGIVSLSLRHAHFRPVANPIVDQNFLHIDPIFNTRNIQCEFTKYDRKEYDIREILIQAEKGNEQAKNMLTAFFHFVDCMISYATDLERNINNFIFHLSESIRTCRLMQNFTEYDVDWITRTVHKVYGTRNLKIDNQTNREILTCLIHLRYIPSEHFIKLIATSVKRFPDVLYFRLAYCDLLFKANEYAKGLEETELALQKFPTSNDLLYIRAKLLVNEGIEVEQSLIALKRFIDSAPSNDYRVAEVFYTTALILYNQNGEDTDEKLDAVVKNYCAGLKAETEILKIFLPYKSYAKDQMTPILEKAPYNEHFVAANERILVQEQEIGLEVK